MTITQRTIDIEDVRIGNDLPFVLMSGPCQIESRDHAMMMAERLKAITQNLSIPFVFKASFDKANRTSLTGSRGAGLEAGLEILAEIKAQFDVPVMTDVHLPDQCAPVADVVDILQIPAFLSRQTDLLIAAAETVTPVMVKKGQFLAPHDMRSVVEKIEKSGGKDILLCERGASFGYNTLVSDFRSLPVMGANGVPVVFDATHSVQAPGAAGGQSGGERAYAPALARAAVAVGCAAIFAECHNDPDHALSDGPVNLYLDDMPDHLASWRAIDALRKSY